MTVTVDQLVQREVNCCLSSLVSTLCEGNGHAFNGLKRNGSTIADLIEQACGLASPVPDYEEALLQAEWQHLAGHPDKFNGASFWTRAADETDTANEDAAPVFESAQEACEFDGLDPYDREVYEFWAVSTWFAEKLAAAGEKVDTDFAGMNVWARTCSGQGIASDGVVIAIHAALTK